jgi:hypothetical protein
MDWMNAVSDIVQRYSGQGGGAASAPADVHADYRQVAEAAPENVKSEGIAQAFRSDQTPPFPQMLANLFGQSNPNQRAGLLNSLLGRTVTAEQASQMSRDEVQQMAAHAEGQNPSVIDQVSQFCAQHPDMMKAVGGLALSIAIQHMMQRR